MTMHLRTTPQKLGEPEELNGSSIQAKQPRIILSFQLKMLNKKVHSSTTYLMQHTAEHYLKGYLK